MVLEYSNEKEKICASPIPVIDLNDFPSESEKLKDACEEWGCFRIINHGVPLSLMLEMKSTVRTLFDIPMEIKRRNTSENYSGYVQRGTVNPLYESLGLHDVGSLEAVNNFCNQLDASPQQRETILRYSKTIHDLAMDIGRKLSTSMGFRTDLFKGWPCQFRINKYNFTTQTIGSHGAATHTDPGFLTILYDDDNVEGLEVLDQNMGKFIAVDPWPSTLVVNLGDIAKAWSNGRFCNIQHRVQCKEATTRLSIALFVLGPKDEEVKTPKELVDSKHPRLYNPFIFDEYRKLRVATKSSVGEALDLFRAGSDNHHDGASSLKMIS